MSSSSSPNSERVAALMELGPRKVQEDRAIAHLHEDGSWTIAAFDGLGGHERGDEAAQVAADAFPERVEGPKEMMAAIREANTAVWALVPHERRRLGRWPSRSDPLTTVAAAAWTPEGGLQTAWMGDSVLFFVPLQAGAPGMHSEPHGSWDSPIMDSGLGFGRDPTMHLIGSMPNVDLRVLAEHIEGDGLIVAAATDGLFDPIRIGRYGSGGRFSEDPLDNSIGFAIPARERTSALGIATALLDAAQGNGLTDNASIAVALARP